MHSRFLVASVLLAGCAGASTGNSGGAPSPDTGGATSAAITEADLRTRLSIYAADSMGGRATGSPGLVKATDYIARELARLGVEPGGENGTYFQNVPVVTRRFDEAKPLSMTGQNFVAFRD